MLPARVERYSAEALDGLCLSGQVSWGRLRLPVLAQDSARSATLSRATPITLAVRDDLAWLIRSARGGASPIEPVQDGPAELLACLRGAGASFFSELLRKTRLSRAELEAALWDGVARGLLHADGFQALRQLLFARARQGSRPELRRSLRQAAGGRSRIGWGALPAEGRWALLPPPDDAADPDAMAEAVAEQLLSRSGVMFRDLFVHEALAVPWRDVVWALRRLEARGTVRGGRFVSGFVGEQYALPEAVELLRAMRKSDRSGVLVRVSACDPLNLVGVILPGPRIPAVRTNAVTYKDGVVVVEEQAAPLTLGG